jgi:hypothetical protein
MARMTAAQKRTVRGLIPSQFSPQRVIRKSGYRFSDKITRHNGFAGVRT